MEAVDINCAEMSDEIKELESIKLDDRLRRLYKAKSTNLYTKD